MHTYSVYVTDTYIYLDRAKHMYFHWGQFSGKNQKHNKQIWCRFFVISVLIFVTASLWRHVFWRDGNTSFQGPAMYIYI